MIGWRWLGRAKPAVVEAVPPPTPVPSPFVTEWLATVEPFENRSGDPSLDVLGRTLGDAVTDALGRVTQGLPSLPPVTVLAARGAGSATMSTGESSPQGQGRLLVTGSYTVRGAGLEVVAQVRDRDGQRLLFACEPVIVPRQPSRDRLEGLLGQLMGALGIHVVTGLENVSHVPDYSVARDFIACQARRYTEGLAAPCDEIDRALERDPEFVQPAYLGAIGGIRDRRPDEAVSYLEHIRQRSARLTAYESTHLALLSAWHQGDLGTALIAARSLHEIAPDRLLGATYRSLFAAGLNRPAEVVESAEALIRTLPRTAVRARRGGEATLLSAYLALGENDKLLALARQIRSESPGSTAAFVNEARALAALGRLDELDSLIEECRSTVRGSCDAAAVVVEASWHLAAYGHRQQSLAYAGEAVAAYQAMSEQELQAKVVYYLYALRVAERWEEYGAFAARCVEERPGDREQPWFRSCVGMAAAHRGDRAAATAILGQLEAEGEYNPAAYVAAHLGERDRAIELLRRSLADGVFTYTQIRHWDLDLQPLWDYPPFQGLIRPKG